MSSAEPSSKRSKVQFGLKAFWGSPGEQAVAEPVTLSEDPWLRNRQQKSQRLIELEELRSKGEELLKAVQDGLPALDKASKAYEAREFFREMGRRGGRPKGRQHSRAELTARQKLDIAEEYEKLLPGASSRQEALTELRKKYQMSSERLKDILKNKQRWEKLCLELNIGKQGGARKGKRAAGVSEKERWWKKDRTQGADSAAFKMASERKKPRTWNQAVIPDPKV